MDRTCLFAILFALLFGASSALAGMPPNVRCAIAAQEKARNAGSEYQNIYRRNFELCMLNAMPRKRQADYLIEKARPYVALSPGPDKQKITQPDELKRSEEHTSELQSHSDLVCRLLL